jgi:hypothetical protein
MSGFFIYYKASIFVKNTKMAEEIYINIQNPNSTTQGVTLWQLPNSNDPQVYLQNLGAASVSNPIGILGDYMWYDSNNNFYYTLSTTFSSPLVNIIKWDSSFGYLGTTPLANTYSSFFIDFQFNPVNNLTYALVAGRIIAFAQTGGAYAAIIVIPFAAWWQIYDSVNNLSYYTSLVSLPNDIIVFDPSTNTILGTILGTAGYEAKCFDSVNQRLIISDATTIIVIDADPSSINYLLPITSFSTVGAGIITTNTGDTGIYQITYNSNNNYLYVLCDSIDEIQVFDSVAYTLVTLIPNFLSDIIIIDNSLNLIYGTEGTIVNIIDCQTNSIISSNTITNPNSSILPILNTNNNNIVFWTFNGSSIDLQLNLPSAIITTEGVPTYEALVNSMYGSNPYKFTKLYISTTSIEQANQPLTINSTPSDGRLNTDLRFPYISPLQRQYVIPELDLNMTANGQSNLQYNVLPYTDVTMIFTYVQAWDEENTKEVEVLYEDVTEEFKQLEINKKNNPLLDMKWDIK